MKSYAQTCPIAVALDAVGERWTLLVLRELLMGDQRFTDLRTNLGGIAPNLLSTRLADLVDRGYVAKAELPPPAARAVYRLTPRGREIGPVLRALSRFGAPELPAAPSPAMNPRRAVHSLVLSWHTGEPLGTDGAVRLVIDGESFDLSDRVGDGAPPGVRVRPSAADPPAPTPAAVLETTVADLMSARRTGTPLPARWTGTPEAQADFTRAFALDLTALAAPARAT